MKTLPVGILRDFTNGHYDGEDAKDLDDAVSGRKLPMVIMS